MECIDKGYMAMCAPKRLWPTNETTAVLIRLRKKPDNDCAVTPTAWATDRADMHAIHRLTDRANMPAIHWPTDRADTHTIYHRPTDCADMPTIPITVVPINLQPEYD